MPEYNIFFEISEPNRMEMPDARLQGGSYSIVTDTDGNVDLYGDQKGLLYLAEVIVRCAIGDYKAGFHVHLPVEGVGTGPNINGLPELTIYSAATGIPQGP